MESFLNDARILSRKISTLNEYTEKVKKLNTKKCQSVLTEEEENSMNAQVAALNDMFKDLSREIKEQLKAIYEQNESIRGTNEFLYQTRNSHCKALTNKLADAVNLYRGTQVEHNQQEKTMLRSQYMIAKPNATEEELDKLVNGEEGEAMLKSAFALGSHSAQRILKRAQNRNKSIRNIVASINELCEMMEDLHEMVKASHAVVDRIEIKVSSAVTSTEQANRELESGLRYQRNIMRIKRIIVGIVSCVIAVIIIWLLLKLRGSGSGSGNSNSE
ncbi:Syntaxin-2 [Astathelohania contejeani]|uniref:Syntaxin-2 n=1 Tax=Astathelohania contejeani TaxID=164912 RepID=A0ABQ7HZD9_9MICR|nr:Syntaxin-2 [Thelohania contejeani]